MGIVADLDTLSVAELQSLMFFVKADLKEAREEWLPEAESEEDRKETLERIEFKQEEVKALQDALKKAARRELKQSSSFKTRRGY